MIPIFIHFRLAKASSAVLQASSSKMLQFSHYRCDSILSIRNSLGPICHLLKYLLKVLYAYSGSTSTHTSPLSSPTPTHYNFTCPNSYLQYSVVLSEGLLLQTNIQKWRGGSQGSPKGLAVLRAAQCKVSTSQERLSGGTANSYYYKYLFTNYQANQRQNIEIFSLLYGFWLTSGLLLLTLISTPSVSHSLTTLPPFSSKPSQRGTRARVWEYRDLRCWALALRVRERERACLAAILLNLMFILIITSGIPSTNLRILLQSKSRGSPPPRPEVFGHPQCSPSCLRSP